jgi:hypothetical protein
LVSAGVTLSAGAAAQSAPHPVTGSIAATGESSPAAPAPAAPAPDTGDHPASNSIYLEGTGAAIAYSINYERLVIDQLAVRLGFSYLTIGASATAGSATTSSSASYLFFPITASYIGIRSGKHSLELGGGATLLYVSGSASGLGTSTSGAGMVPYGTVLAGYRLHPVGHAGFQFRIGVMALIGQGLGLQNPNPNSVGVIPWPYLSLGASF